MDPTLAPSPRYEQQEGNFNVETTSEQTLKETKQETTSLRTGIEVPPSYGKSFLEYLEDHPQTAATITGYLTPPETLETRSEKIENIWGDFALGAIDKKLQDKLTQEPGLHQNIKTGLSLYFTDWINTLSSGDLKEVAKIGSGMTGIIDSANKLFGLVKNLTSFKDQMNALSFITEGMDVYTDNLVAEGEENISQIESFKTPEGFAGLLKKHTLKKSNISTGSIASFEDYFSIDGQASFDSGTTMENLATSYKPQAHQLMEKVALLGPQVLEGRTTMKETFGSLYDTISQVVDSLPFLTKGKTLSELIKGTRFEAPLNFVASILGFGSISRYEQKQKIKSLTKKCPEGQKNGLHHVINYISDPNNDRNQSGQRFTQKIDAIDEKILTEKKITKEDITKELPNENFLKQGILDSFNNEKNYLFIHPRHLEKAGIPKTKIDECYTTDQEGNLQINPAKKSDYKQLIIDNLDTILQKAWFSDGGLFNLPTIISLIKSGKGKGEISTYLLSGLSFPDYALDVTTSGFVATSNTLPTVIPYPSPETGVENQDKDVDLEKIKEGIFANESKHIKNPYNAKNPVSTAVGKYQFLWKTRNKEIKKVTGLSTIQEYVNSPIQQEKFMDHIVINEYLPKAKEYQSLYPNRKLPEIIMLIHFKGNQGALTWIKDRIDNTTANNVSINTYVDKFQKVYYS